MYSRETHLKMADCLREAKGYLWNGNQDLIPEGKPTHICIAINYTFYPSVETKRRVRNWIDGLLGEDSTLMTYIASRKPTLIRTDGRYDRVKIQQARFDFIDYLISVLES